MSVPSIRPIPVAPLAAVAIACAALAGVAPAQQATARMSVDSNGIEGDSGGHAPALSADGRFVAFESLATNLVPGDTNGVSDIFVHDRVTGATVRVSVDSAGNEADNTSTGATISGDGRFVAFQSVASKLVLHDTNGKYDVFVHDRDPDGNGVFDEGNGVTTRVSVDSNGVQGDGQSFNAAISADGTRVAFQSSSDNLVPGDGNDQQDVFVHDRVTGTTVRASVDSAGAEADNWSSFPSLSADGRVVAFSSFARNLVAGGTSGNGDVFLHDLSSGATTRASVDSSGVGGTQMSFTTSWSLSADGTRVAFVSAAPNLVADDTNLFFDAFVHDATTGTTVRASLGQGDVQSDANVWFVAISGDGNGAVFVTAADDLVPHDGNGVEDVFLRDLAHGTTELVSRDFAARSGDGLCIQGTLDADGSLVAFDSLATDLVAGDGNDWIDVFVLDRTVVPLQASWTNYGAGFAGTQGVPGLTLSADPEFGATFLLDVGNSSAQWSVAFVVVGTARAAIPLHSGATLLAVPQSIFPYGLPPSGLPIACTVPFDIGLYGFLLDVQAVEFDAGAKGGLSFTPGLELVFGQ